MHWIYNQLFTFNFNNMKNLLKIAIMLFAVVAFTACNNAPAKEEVAEPAAEMVEPAAAEEVVEPVVEETMDSTAVEAAPEATAEEAAPEAEAEEAPEAEVK